MIMLTDKAIATIERALGLVEGIGYGIEDSKAQGLFTAVEMITEVMYECEGIKI